MKIAKWSDVLWKMQVRPCGYLSRLAGMGKPTPEGLAISDVDFVALRGEFMQQEGSCGYDEREYRVFFDAVDGWRWKLPAPGQMPDLLTMAKNAAGAIATTAKHIDEPQVSEEERARREAICDGCEYYTKNIPGKQHTEKNHRCLLCGCFMALKQRQAGGECDAGKW